MGRTVNEKLAQVSKERREKIERRAAELILEEYSLRDLRRALGRTQAKLASSLKVGQDTVARYEQRSDMLLSTLRHCIEALGGQLSLVADFPGRPSVRLKGFADIASIPDTARGPRRRDSSRRARAS